MPGKTGPENDTVSNDNNADSHRSISDIKRRPDLKINEIGNMTQSNTVEQIITNRAAQYQTDTRPDQHTVKKGPVTAHDKDEDENNNDADNSNNQ